MHVQLEGDGVLSQGAHYHDQPPQQIDHPFATDLGTLVHLAGRLQRILPPNYRWLGQEDLKVVGIHPIDAGSFADVWVGDMDDRRVAVKSYRCYTSGDGIPTYNVSYP